jgi:hypothetical protein
MWENFLIFGNENKNSELDGFMKKLRAYYISITIRTIQFRTSSLPICYLNGVQLTVLKA